MNEFVVNLKLLNFKNGKLKREFWEISKLNGYKKILTLIVIFFQIHLRNNQKE